MRVWGCLQVRLTVRVGTTLSNHNSTLNNHNRPTRVATAVSLAISHSHSPKWSTCRFQSSFPGAGVLTATLFGV